ncbi:MAG: DedA family protein [Actinobacteria bacterium]|nr:DedA family protein [Actinomycetota bacterium]
MFEIVDAIKEWIVHSVRDYGYLAVFLLMVLESACIPIPSEVTMLFGGALASAAFVQGAGEPLSFTLVVVAGTAGNLVGSWLAYWVGLRGGRPLIERWGRFVLIRPHEIDRAEVWFAKHGQAAVFVSRMLPVVRTFISLPAGVARMPFGRFTAYTVLGCIPWNVALTALGFALGQNWERVEAYFTPISVAVAVVLAGLIAWWVVKRLRSRRAEATGSGVPARSASRPGPGDGISD